MGSSILITKFIPMCIKGSRTLISARRKKSRWKNLIQVLIFCRFAGPTEPDGPPSRGMCLFTTSLIPLRCYKAHFV